MSEESVEERFAKETSGVADPTSEPIVGEIFPPGVDQGGEQETFPIEEFITEEFVAAIFAMPGAIMARKTGHEWWRPDEDEEELLGKGATPAVKYLIAKYLGGEAGPFAALGAVLAVVYAPKVMQEVNERKKDKNRPSGSPPSQSAPNSPRSAASQPSSASGAAGSPTSSSDFAVPLDD